MLRSLSSPEDIAAADNAHDVFVGIWNDVVVSSGRPSADRMLRYLDGDDCDFFSAPSSTRYHGACIGGLCEHSLNVYWCLKDILGSDPIYRELGVTADDASIAVIALLHDLCKVNFYKAESRNRKNAAGRWEAYAYFSFDDSFPYGHGEKSVYMASKFMPLSSEEAMAIRWHMGFSDCSDPVKRNNFSAAVKTYPLVLALNEADTRAALLLEA